MITILSLLLVLAVGVVMALVYGGMVIALAIIGVMILLLFFIGKPQRPTYGGKFKDTPEAWKAREVIPGETREQARQRLQQYRKQP